MKNTAAVSLSGWRREASNERHLALLFSIILANIVTSVIRITNLTETIRRKSSLRFRYLSLQVNACDLPLFHITNSSYEGKHIILERNNYLIINELHDTYKLSAEFLFK